MKHRIIIIIKRWPGLYRLVAGIYYTFRLVHVAELFIGTKARERQWATREIAEGYWDTGDNPVKRFLRERVANFSPVSSLIEVGSASGANLYLLAKEHPKAQLVGIDINTAAVQYGKKQFAREGITNVELQVGKADELGKFQDKSFDILFTNALLIYIGPDKIEEVIKNMIRITRQALILIELQLFESEGRRKDALGLYQHDNWVRDYAALFRQFTPEEQIRVTKLPEGIWPVEPWQDSGAIIEVVT
ncbi:class I SAM-dependent methyltransferase [Chloroflexota bacterium]